MTNDDQLYATAHQVKSALWSLQGFIHLAIECLENEQVDTNGRLAEGLEYLRHADRASRLIVQTLHDLLEAKALESNPVLNKMPCDLSALARGVVQDNQGLAAAKGISLHLDIPSSFPAEVDAYLMREAINNLVSNAIKYSPPGASAWVSVQAAPDQAEAVHIEVRDEGLGLTVEDKARAFKEFQPLSARPTDGEPSTGLGLAIVKKTVELHGGTVTVESNGRNEGSLFRITLPT